MPIYRDMGGAAYVPPDAIRHERPEDFLSPDVYRERLEEARWRILEAIRFATKPQCGVGMSHEVVDIGTRADDLVNYIDTYDGRHARQVRDQRLKTPHGKRAAQQGSIWRARSPQDRKRRRWALFRIEDISDCDLRKRFLRNPKSTEAYQFVELMRWLLIEDTVLSMIGRGEIGIMNDRWYVKVSVMDKHRKARRSRRHGSGVQVNDHSYHGKPRRDRKRPYAA